MPRSIIVCAFVAALAVPRSAGASPIAGSMGDLRWGLSEEDVVRFLVRKTKERANDEVAKARGAKRAEIEQRLQRQLRQIQESLVEFNGGRTRWDSGPVADQFTHGNAEAMLAFDDGKSRNYYFFINGNLWKWYKSFPASDFGGRDFKRFSKVIAKKYGTGRVKQGEMYPGTGEERQWLEYLDRNTRLRAVDKTDPHGEYGLVFEEMATVRDLASLRTQSAGPSRSRLAATRRAPEPADEDEEEDTSARTSGSAQKHRSIDAGTADRGETRAEYEERKKRVITSEKKRQREVFDRKQDRQQGTVLDALAGINDDDPISGMK
jgi:hypothetical protein